MILHDDHGMLDVGISMRRELYTHVQRASTCVQLWQWKLKWERITRGRVGEVECSPRLILGSQMIANDREIMYPVICQSIAGFVLVVLITAHMVQFIPNPLLYQALIQLYTCVFAQL